MKKTLREWFDFYEKKTKEKHINLDKYKTLFDEEKGYCQFCIQGNDLMIHECCGDGLFWCKYAFDFAKEHSLKRIVTLCTRNILPYIRRMNGVIKHKEVRQFTNNGLEIYGISPYGKFRCFPVWRNEDTKRNAYCVVCEVMK